MTSRRLFICASHSSDPNWRWLAHRMPDVYAWRFVTTAPRNVLERRVRRPYIARYRAALEAAWRAKGDRADLLVSHLPLMTSYTALAGAATRMRAPHLAFAFNFTVLPQGPRRELMRRAFTQVDRFVVPSTVERKLYSEHFDLPLEKIDMLLWAVQKPFVPADAEPIIAGDYICAIGGEGRDYATLADAMRLLPLVRLVLVARPHNLKGISVPDNVTTMTNIPLASAWNILHFSRFSVLPLRDSEVPCGHVTLVAGMHLGKALVITDSAGVADYVQNDVTALTCPLRDPVLMARRIQELWDDRALTARISASAQHFAGEQCTEDTTLQYFERYLREKSLDIR